MVKVTRDDPKIMEEQLRWAVEAKPVEFSDTQLAAVSDFAEIKKTYKLGGVLKGARESSAEDGRAERQEAESIILGMMALRGAT